MIFPQFVPVRLLDLERCYTFTEFNLKPLQSYGMMEDLNFQNYFFVLYIIISWKVIMCLFLEMDIFIKKGETIIKSAPG